MIPIYFGVDDANEGLATGTENYWCVNKNASEADVKATLDFMNWCVTNETALKAMCGSAKAMPSGADGMLTTLYPAIAALAGFVPCAESGTRIFVRFSSDRLS